MEIACLAGRASAFSRLVASRLSASPAPLARSFAASPVARRPSAYGVFVHVEIKPDHVDEFKRVMAADVAGSRKEERCRRFDLMAVDGSSTEFCFYEVYEDEAVRERPQPDQARAAIMIQDLLLARRRSRTTRRSITTRNGPTSRPPPPRLSLVKPRPRCARSTSSRDGALVWRRASADGAR